MPSFYRRRTSSVGRRAPGENILEFAAGELDRTLLEHELVDEDDVWLFLLAFPFDTKPSSTGILVPRVLRSASLEAIVKRRGSRHDRAKRALGPLSPGPTSARASVPAG